MFITISRRRATRLAEMELETKRQKQISRLKEMLFMFYHVGQKPILQENTDMDLSKNRQ